MSDETQTEAITQSHKSRELALVFDVIDAGGRVPRGNLFLEDFSVYWGCDVSTFKRYLKDNKVPVRKIGDKTLVNSEAFLDAIPEVPFGTKKT